jgi:hypothetical protein
MHYFRTNTGIYAVNAGVEMVQASASAVPEPTAFALLIFGVMFCAAIYRRD